jgi:pimeloyl-ACP methyl ester carboxylesterase
MDEVIRLAGGAGEPALLLRRQKREGAPVLYVHGATFPSALSAAYRFEGRSWLDDLSAAGFDAWAFDFAGFGGSERYAEMALGQEGRPLGRAEQAVAQLARAVERVAEASGRRVALVAHSWGSIPAGLYASRRPERVERLCLFGPIARRDGHRRDGPGVRWRLITVAEQLARFVEDVPRGHPPVLIEPTLESWGPAYLASDPDARSRTPAAVKIPAGPVADVAAAWAGNLSWRPEDVVAPTLVVRGEWDSVTNDDDARWILSRISHPLRRDVKVPKGTHLMHLELSREGLFEATRTFLKEPSA